MLDSASGEIPVTWGNQCTSVIKTSAVVQWLERPSRKRETVGSLPGRIKPDIHFGTRCFLTWRSTLRR